MLLHVIEAARPIQLAAGALALEGFRQKVRYSFPFVHDVGNLDPAESTGIEGLASGGGVERGSVKVHPPALIGPFDNNRLEIAQIAVGIVEPLGHGAGSLEERVRVQSEKLIGWRRLRRYRPGAGEEVAVR
jgi:hypothetical protein